MQEQSDTLSSFMLYLIICGGTVQGQPKSINFPFFSRLKIEELEAERSKLAEENRSLGMQLEKLTLQVGVGRSRAAGEPGVVHECSQHGASLPSIWARHLWAACGDCTATPVL